MSVNASPPPHPNTSSINLEFPFQIYCLVTRPSSIIYTSVFATHLLLLLPVSILVFHLGLRQRRQQRSALSHSDSFTYHVTAMELFAIFGSALCCCGVYTSHFYLMWVGLNLSSLAYHGETFFHTLTCVERYLAVIHPVTYLSLRGERGLRIRNISTGCVWLFSAAAMCVLSLEEKFFTMTFCILIFSLIVTSFCSLSVLCVLIRPGPGEQGGERERVDKSKQRAFYSIVAILGVLLVRCCWGVGWIFLNVTERDGDCMLLAGGLWFNLPSSLVLPLLYLHRAGTLACCKSSTK